MSLCYGKLERTILAMISLLILYAVFWAWLDIPIDQWAHETFPNTPFFFISEYVRGIFQPSHWVIIAIISIVIGIILRFIIKKPQGRAFLFFGCSVTAAFIICGILKVLLARYRPIEYFNHGTYGFHFLSTQHDMNSTPSGHATTAFAGLYALAAIIKKPAVTVFLLIIAVLIGLSRIIDTDHFPSDVILGAYIGIWVVSWFKCLFNYSRQTKRK